MSPMPGWWRSGWNGWGSCRGLGSFQLETPQASVLHLGLPCTLVSDMNGSAGILWICRVGGLPNGQQVVIGRGRGYTAVSTRPLGMGWGGTRQKPCAKAAGALG